MIKAVEQVADYLLFLIANPCLLFPLMEKVAKRSRL
jgi:hypothetical protein